MTVVTTPGNDRITLLLRVAACTLLMGRAWLYLTGIGPLSTFFWHEGWLEGPLDALFGMSWVDYASNSDAFILHVQRIIGAMLSIGAIAVWRTGRDRPISNGIVLTTVLLLLPYWLLRWVDKNYQFPMLLEHFLQWGTPLLLLLKFHLKTRTWYTVAAAFVALTFIGHGLYAMGWPAPRPAHFIFMTMEITGCSEKAAVGIMHTAALLDFIVAIGLFIPRARIPALMWAAAWGIATAVARIWAHVTPAEAYYGIQPWLAESILRLTHGLVPLAMLACLPRKSKKAQD